MESRKTLLTLVFAAAVSSTALPSFAQTSTSQTLTPLAATAPTAVPALVPYSGIVLGDDGKVLSGETGVTFQIYKDEQGGQALWAETQTVALDPTGHYKTQLGATDPNGLPSDLFSTGEARWLEVQVAGQAPQPRVLLASVPYALKAADATTLGGLPASAYALAGANAVPNAAPTAPDCPKPASVVTSPGGTANKLAKFAGAESIVDSLIFDNGTNVGIGTTKPAEKLDVNGESLLRGDTTLYRSGDATAAGGSYSRSLIFNTEAFDSATQAAVQTDFLWKGEFTGNNTASPSATLNLLISNGGPVAETGFRFRPNGTIDFAPGQTFPGTGAGSITGVTAGTGLTGGGTSGNVTLNLNTAQVPLLSGNNAFIGNETITGSVTSSSNLSYAIEGIDSSSGGSGLFGMATSTSGYSSGVFGTSASTTGSGVAGTATSMTGFTNGVYGRTASSSGTGVGGAATSATGYTNGVYGTSASPNGTGVSGNASSLTGNAIGTSGTTASPAGVGVQGVNFSATGGSGVNGISLATSGYTTGVYGKSLSANGSGVSGQAISASGFAVGVNGASSSPQGAGVQGVNSSATGGTGLLGYAAATSGYSNGVYASAVSPNGTGVNGAATSATGYTNGVFGSSASPTGTGVHGDVTAPNGQGIYGTNEAATGQANGVLGVTASSAGNGVSGVATGTSGYTVGVYGTASSPLGVGVRGDSLSATGSSPGVYGYATSPSGIGVSGSATSVTGNTRGVYGGSSSPQGSGVFGNNNSTTGLALGVIGFSSSASDGGQAVAGYQTGASGVTYGVVGGGDSPQGFGVFGHSPNVGVVGSSQTSTPCGGVALTCPLTSGTGGEFVTASGGLILSGQTGTTLSSASQVFYVDSTGSGYFAGNLNVTGKVVKGSGSFKIDDPLDPANKYLSHSFVESPDMMNVYNGNVKTDKFGRATVELPEYFEALNSDFRYQLTVMGQFAQAIVAQKVGVAKTGHNRFMIRTNKPSVEVSWQVTGIRKDAYAAANRIPVEEEKPANERGYYLHPEVFNQPPSKGIVAAHQTNSPSNSVVAQLGGAGNR